MVTKEQNDRLARVGKGTPGGEMLRRYWHPIAPAAKLDENPVQSIRILGEDLVLYRDNSGDLGLIGKQCGHRLVDMVFGIPDEHGIRCPYHGWCYDESGQCTDTPLESPNSKLKSRVNIGGYPVQEMGGLVWAYLGPPPAPVLPPYDFLVWPNSLRQIGVTELPCNWLQCHENSADPFHNTYLHGYFFKYQLERMGMLSERAGDEGAHRTFVSIHGTDHADGIAFTRDTYGFRKGIKMSKERGAKEDSIRWFPDNIYPYFSRSGGGLRTQINIRVPIDDTHTLHLHYGIFNIPDTTVTEQSPIPYYEAPIFDEQGQPILDYVMAQDAAAWWSQGELTDRSREQLGATDLAIIEFRKIIEEQITAVEEGRDPMNVFRDPAAVPSSINFDPPIGAEVRNLARSGSSIDKINVSRSMFHRGYSNDDIDRYGPITPQIAELMRAAEERTS